MDVGVANYQREESTELSDSSRLAAMGTSESSFKKSYEETVSQLSSVQLREITTHFGEVYAKAGGGKGHLVDREAFSKYFKLPVTVGERLFESFDVQRNGRISFEEFVCGLAILLHGSFSNKCRLLFQMFNIHGDDGISREELATMLHSILTSTSTIVMAMSHSDRPAVLSGEDQDQAIKAMVDSAFRNCDITGTGKLLPLEFEYWVKRNPKILDSLLSFHSQDSQGTLGALLLSSPETDSLDSTVTVPLHSASRDDLRSSPFTLSSSHQHLLTPSQSPAALKITHSLRPIQSEPAIVSMAKSHHPLQTLDKLALSSPLAVQMGPSSPTLMADSEADGQPELETERLHCLSSVETDTDTGDLAMSGLGEVHFMKSVSLGTHPIDSEAEGSMEVKFTMEPLQEEEEEQGKGEGGEDVSMGVWGDKEGEEVINLEEEEEETEKQVVEEEAQEDEEEKEEEKEKEVDQTGSIMQSEAMPFNVNLDLPEIEEDEGSLSPSSPLLPPTMEAVALELQGDVVEEEGEQEEDEEEGVGPEPLSLNAAELSEGVELREGHLLTTSEGATPTEVSMATTIATIVEPSQVTTGFRVEESSGHQIEPSDRQTALNGQQLESESSNLYQPLPVPISIDLPTSSQAPPPEEDVGPHPVVLTQRRPSPFPWAVEGGKEALYTAWIPSPWALGLLSQPSSTVGQHLTCPGLKADIRTEDVLAELMSTHYPDQQRKAQLTVESVTMDVEGLQKLVMEGCYHAALELTSRFLTAHGQGLGQAGQPTIHTHKTMQMWCARIALLVQTQHFQEAESELSAFRELDSPDLFYQFHTHNYPGKAGSMLPFSLRLLHAQIPSYTGNHRLSLDRLCMLMHTCQEVLNEVRRGFLPFVKETLGAEEQQVAELLWVERLARVKISLSNTLVAMEDYLLAIQVYESLQELVPQLSCDLLSVCGQVSLCMGDLASAQNYFSAATAEEGEVARSHLNQGLVNVFLSRWQLARDSFEAALQLEPTSLTLRNNIAICTFYQGHLKECISLMESLLHSSPPSSLQPAVLTNIAAAYDLESGNGQTKKLAFLPLLAQHVGEGFPISSACVK